MELSKREREKYIALLNAGQCPFCGQNGFKKILIHVRYAHGLSASEIKDSLLVNTNKGFCSEETANLHKTIALRQGFGKEVRPLTQPDRSSVKTITKKKMSLMAKTPEHKELFKKNMENPITREKANIILYGSPKGYPDEFYAQIARDFITALTNGTKRSIYTRMAKEKGIKPTAMQAQVKTAEARGMIVLNGKPGCPDGYLTKKCIKLLSRQKP